VTIATDAVRGIDPEASRATLTELAQAGARQSLLLQLRALRRHVPMEPSLVRRDSTSDLALRLSDLAAEASAYRPPSTSRSASVYEPSAVRPRAVSAIEVCDALPLPVVSLVT
jgi:hypothetical protein